MRVAPSDLKAVVANGLVTRYAVLGGAVMVIVETPPDLTAPGLIEERCSLEHRGLLARGSLTLREASRGRTFDPGTAFYVAPGVEHSFEAEPRTVVVGFAPVVDPVDDSPAALKARGIRPIRRTSAPVLLPKSVHVDALPTHRAVSGHVETEGAVMGDWLFTRSAFGSLSGHLVDWCDLPHWGLVLDGSLVLHWDDGPLELLGPGDAFHTPSGPPGHRFEVADAATIIDYTPIAAFGDGDLRKARRARAAIGAELLPDELPV